MMMTKKGKRRYNRLLKQYRKSLKTFAANWDPTNYDMMLLTMSVMIKGMRDFYNLGIDYMRSDPLIGPSRLEICNELSTLIDLYFQYSMSNKVKASAFLIEFCEFLSHHIEKLQD